MPLWRPSLPESSDTAPLTTTIPQLLYDFPYDRLPSNALLAALLRPDVVLALLVLYNLSKPPLALLRDAVGISPKSTSLRAFIAVHNLALAAFSAACAWNGWGVVGAHAVERGFFATYCDTDGTLWRNGFGAWSTIFYASKYYEMLDTWILVLKGKTPSFLQVYHHTGVILTMWGGVVSQSSWLLFVLLLNSVIHTIMYTYYFVKTIAPSVEIRAAKYLTQAQIIQFFIGIVGSAGILLTRCDTQSSMFSLVVMDVYGVGLILLFISFAKKRYKKA